MEINLYKGKIITKNFDINTLGRNSKNIDILIKYPNNFYINIKGKKDNYSFRLFKDNDIKKTYFYDNNCTNGALNGYFHCYGTYISGQYIYGKDSLIKKFNLYSGVIYFFNFNKKDLEDLELLGEDIMSISYINNIILDVGYHQHGFKIYIIKNQDWENPLETIECGKDFETMVKKVNETAKKISEGKYNKET